MIAEQDISKTDLIRHLQSCFGEAKAGLPEKLVDGATLVVTLIIENKLEARGEQMAQTRVRIVTPPWSLDDPDDDDVMEFEKEER